MLLAYVAPHTDGSFVEQHIIGGTPVQRLLMPE